MKKYLSAVILVVVLFIIGSIYVDRTGKKLTLPKNSEEASKMDFQNLGPAPDFIGISHWLNSEPLKIDQLKGKVVLVDFWTYTCINCIRTLPYVTKWYDTYKDKGLVVVGVHTPEFAFEKETSNVADAIKKFKINYPVAQDNDYKTWNNYSNQYWPAEYLINQKGEIVYTHFGEGNYDHTENAIRNLLGLNMDATKQPGQELGQVGSPEMYFGTKRLENLSSAQQSSLSEKKYIFPSNLKLNTFALEGFWQFTQEGSVTTQPNSKIRLNFHSRKVHIVAQSQKPQTIKVNVDGKPQADVIVEISQLYTLFDSRDYNDHVIEITIPDSGFEAFTFTFG